MVLERWVVFRRVTTLPLLWVVVPLYVVKLLYILGATSEVAGCSPPQFMQFGVEPAGLLQSFEACCWSHLTHLGGSTAVG